MALPASTAAAPISDEAWYLRAAILAGLALTLARLVWLAAEPTDLYPDEAQYWLWSRSLDWGYFSKPPLIAWIIRATTSLFGETGFGIRFAAPLCHFLTSLAVYGTGRRLVDARTGCWSAVTFVTLPAVWVSAFLISTDVPLLLCWAVGLYAFIRAREETGWGWWAVVGIAGGLGLLAKYAMAYWLLSALLYLAVFRDERRHLPRFLAAAALAFLVYAPNLAWNLANGLVSYRHTEANAQLGGSLVHPGRFAEFAASQFGVFGPILFGALIVLLCAAPRRLAEPPFRLLGFFALPTLAMMLVVSFLSRAHPNWAAPTYVPATVLVVAWLLRAGREKLLAASLALHLAAGAVLMIGPQAAHAAGIRLPAQLDPWNRLRGWAALGRAVSELRLRHLGYGLLAEDRELMAALAYYVLPHPVDIVAWNPTGRITDHFTLTTDLERHRGGDFLFITPADDVSSMAPHFASVEQVATITVPRGPDRARRYNVFAVRGFKGYR